MALMLVLILIIVFLLEFFVPSPLGTILKKTALPGRPLRKSAIFFITVFIGFNWKKL